MWNFPCFMLLFRFIPLFLLSTWTYLHALVFNNQITVISFLFSAQSRPHPLFLSSQPHRSPDCWFEGLVCEKGLCEFLCGLSDLIFSQYLWHSDLLWDQKINKHLTFYYKGPLRFLPKQEQFLTRTVSTRGLFWRKSPTRGPSSSHESAISLSMAKAVNVLFAWNKRKEK